jgi:hypothetical protein
MKARELVFGFLPILTIPLAVRQQTPSKRPPPTPVETSMCKILDDPSSYNNKLVKIRGYVQASFEYSVLLDEACPDRGIWFALADGSGPPELLASVTGKGTPGSRDSKGRVGPPVSVRLTRDSNLEKLQHYWALSAKGEACANAPVSTQPPDCTTYRVTATFIGRVDGVSKEVHAARLKRSSSEGTDWKGFGHMGLFDAQIVVQSVDNVVAEDASAIGKAHSKPE